jgi:hypothetical protein
MLYAIVVARRHLFAIAVLALLVLVIHGYCQVALAQQVTIVI